MESVLCWLTVVFDAVCILASLVAVVIYAVLYVVTARSLKANGEHDVVITASHFKRWVRANAVMSALILLNTIRWFALNDFNKVRGMASTTTGLDDFTGAVCGLLLLVLPIVLIGNMRAVLREKGGAHG